jgi:hypothetical protein
VAPPGAYGTTIFTGFDGYLSCAEAVTVPNARHSSAKPKPTRLIAFSLWIRFLSPLHEKVGGFPLM